MYNPSSGFWACLYPPSQLGLENLQRNQGDILMRYFSWLLLTQGSSSSPRISKLLTLPLWLSSATRWRTLIFAACICNLIFSGQRWWLDRRWTSKLRVCLPDQLRLHTSALVQCLQYCWHCTKLLVCVKSIFMSLVSRTPRYFSNTLLQTAPVPLEAEDWRLKKQVEPRYLQKAET